MVRQASAGAQPLGHRVPHLCPLVGIGIDERLAAEIHFDHGEPELSQPVDHALATTGIDKYRVRLPCVHLGRDLAGERHVVDARQNHRREGDKPLPPDDHRAVITEASDIDTQNLGEPITSCSMA